MELELTRLKDDVIYLNRDNLEVLKQRNILCLIAKHVHFNITQLHLDCEIGKGYHKMILPFLELKEDEISVDCYRCESIVSSDNVSDSYRIGLENFYLKRIKNKSNQILYKILINYARN